jgi:hypothetical protein
MSDAFMNGMPKIAIQNPIVMLLEQVLSDAKSGAISSIAVIAITPKGGCATPWAGQQIGDMYMGAGVFQRRVLRTIDPPPEQRSPLVRAPAGLDVKGN